MIKASSNVNRSVNGLFPYIHFATCTNVQHGIFGNVLLIVLVNCSHIGTARCLIDVLLMNLTTIERQLYIGLCKIMMSLWQIC